MVGNKSISLGAWIPPLCKLKPAWKDVVVQLPPDQFVAEPLPTAHVPSDVIRLGSTVPRFALNGAKATFADSWILLDLEKELPAELCTYTKTGVTTRSQAEADASWVPTNRKQLFILLQSKQHTAEDAVNKSPDDVQKEFEKCIDLSHHYPFLLLVLSDAEKTTKPAALDQAVFVGSNHLPHVYGTWMWKLRRRTRITAGNVFYSDSAGALALSWVCVC